LKEHKDTYVTVIEKHTLDGSNTITLMKHKYRYVTLVKSTRMDGVNTAATTFSTVVYCYNEFQADRLIR